MLWNYYVRAFEIQHEIEAGHKVLFAVNKIDLHEFEVPCTTLRVQDGKLIAT
jgi:hypothetical protein